MAEQWEHVEGINSRAISAQGGNIRQWQGNGSNHKGIEVNFTLEQDLLTAIFESYKWRNHGKRLLTRSGCRR